MVYSCLFRQKQKQNPLTFLPRTRQCDAGCLFSVLVGKQGGGEMRKKASSESRPGVGGEGGRGEKGGSGFIII